MRLGSASGEALRGRFVCVRKRKASSCQMAPPAENLRVPAAQNTARRRHRVESPPAQVAPLFTFSPRLSSHPVYSSFTTHFFFFFFYPPHTVTSTGGHVGCRHVALVTGGHKFVRPTVTGSKGKKTPCVCLGRGVEGGVSVTLFLARAHGCL